MLLICISHTPIPVSFWTVSLQRVMVEKQKVHPGVCKNRLDVHCTHTKGWSQHLLTSVQSYLKCRKDKSNNKKYWNKYTYHCLYQYLKNIKKSQKKMFWKGGVLSALVFAYTWHSWILREIMYNWDLIDCNGSPAPMTTGRWALLLW